MSSTPEPPRPPEKPASIESSTPEVEGHDATPRQPRRAWIRPAAGALGCMILGGALGFGLAKVDWPAASAQAATATPSPSASPVLPIKDAMSRCGVSSSSYFSVGDGGTSLTVESGGKSYGASMTDTYCVLHRLQAPDSMISRMGQTRALDGRQSATWKGYSASWGYHPDSGMNLVVESSDSHS